MEIIKDTMQFLNGVRDEFARVTWPTKVELAGTAVVVLLLTVFFAIYLGVVNFLLSSIAAKIF